MGKVIVGDGVLMGIEGREGRVGCGMWGWGRGKGVREGRSKGLWG